MQKEWVYQAVQILGRPDRLASRPALLKYVLQEHADWLDRQPRDALDLVRPDFNRFIRELVAAGTIKQVGQSFYIPT